MNKGALRSAFIRQVPPSVVTHGTRALPKTFSAVAGIFINRYRYAPAIGFEPGCGAVDIGVLQFLTAVVPASGKECP
jgi:hypothetical protein